MDYDEFLETISQTEHLDYVIKDDIVIVRNHHYMTKTGFDREAIHTYGFGTLEVFTQQGMDEDTAIVSLDDGFSTAKMYNDLNGA